MTEKRIPVGTPQVPGLVLPGDDVLYLADVALFGPMEFRRIVESGPRRGFALCRLDSGEFELFEPVEISTVEAVAKHAARGLDDAAAGAAA